MLNSNEVIPLIFDGMFKKVFVENKEYLKILLERILDIKIMELEILNEELIGDYYDKKKTVLDLVVKITESEIINVEVNTDSKNSIMNRNLVYLCRLISNDLKKEEKYKDLRKHIQINLDKEGRHIRPIEEYELIDKKTNNVLTDRLKIIRIDIDYFMELCYNKERKELTDLEKILGLIGTRDKKQIEDLSKGDEYMEKIVKDQKEYSKDNRMIEVYYKEDEYKRLYDTKEEVEEAKKEAREQGIQEGIQQGSNETKTEIVLNALKNNLSIEVISSITGLSIDEINTLKEK